MSGFSVTGEELVRRGHAISWYDVTMAAPDGSEHHREVIRHPGAVGVVASSPGGVVLVRQWRVAVGRELLELPAGKLDRPGEDPLSAAARELAEEVGLRAERLSPLISFHNSPGFCDEWLQVFLAEGLTEVEDSRDGVEEEHLEVLTVPWEDVPRLISAGDIVDAKTLIGLFAAMARSDLRPVPPSP